MRMKKEGMRRRKKIKGRDGLLLPNDIEWELFTILFIILCDC